MFKDKLTFMFGSFYRTLCSINRKWIQEERKGLGRVGGDIKMIEVSILCITVKNVIGVPSFLPNCSIASY